MQLFKVFATIGLDSSEFDSGISEAKSVIGGFAKAAGAAAIAVGAAMAGIGTAALGLGERMNQSMGAIQAQTGAASDEMAFLENHIRDAALAQGNFSQMDMAGALEKIAMYSRNAGDLVGLLDVGMALANATGGDLGGTLYVLGGAMDKLQKSTTEAYAVANVFAAAYRHVGVSINDTLKFLGRVAPYKDEIGMSTEGLAGLFGILYQEQINAVNSSGGLANVLQTLTAQTGRSAEKMYELGISAFHADGTQRDLMDVVDDLRASMSGMTEQQRSLTLEQLGFSQYGRAVVDVLLTQHGRIGELTVAMYGATGALEGYSTMSQMAALRTGGLGEGFGLLRNQGREVLLTISDIIAQPFSEMLHRATGETGALVERLREGGDLHPLMVKLGGAIADLAGRLFDAALALKPIVVEWLPRLADWLGRLIGFVADNYRWIAKLVVGFKALKVALGIYKTVKAVTFAFKGMAVAANAAGKATAKGLVKGLKAAKSGVKAAAAALVKGVKIGLKGGKVAIVAIGKLLGKAFKAAFKGGAKVGKLGGKVVGGIGKALKGGKGVMGKAGGGIATAFTGALKGKGAKGGAKAAGKGLLAALGPKGWIAGGIVALGVVAYRNREAIGSFFERMGETARNAASSVWEATKGAAGRVADFHRDVRDSVVSGGREIANAALDFGRNTVEGVRTAFSQARDVGTDFVRNLTDGVSVSEQGAIGAAVRLAGNVVDAVRGAASGMRDVGANLINSLTEGANSMAGRAVEAARNIADNVVSGIRNVFGIRSPSSVFGGIGENIVYSFTDKVMSLQGHVKRSVDSVFGGIGGYTVNAAPGGRHGGGFGAQATAGKGDTYIDRIEVSVNARDIKEFGDFMALFENPGHGRIVYGGV